MSLDDAAIASTLENENLLVRNLQVTVGYYRLSQGMRKLIGSHNVSWVGFATHASKTAGQAIRHELMPKRMKSAMIRAAGYDETFFFLNDVLVSEDHEPSEHPSEVATALGRVSLLVSEGNVTVYAELARPFLRLIEAFSHDWDRDDSKLAALMDEHLQPGPIEQGGQDYLIEALTAYYSARFETDSKKKAELVFQGNMLVGLHEQTRLQPFIEQALLVPLEMMPNRRQADDPTGKDHAQHKILSQTIMKWGTKTLMSLTLPNRGLRLGEDVIAPTGVERFPQDLIVLENPRVRELVFQFDRGLNTLSGSAASNWGSLDDRMAFIVDLFRSHQQYKRLFEAPFLEDQISAIEDGYLPAGPL